MHFFSMSTHRVQLLLQGRLCLVGRDEAMGMLYGGARSNGQRVAVR